MTRPTCSVCLAALLIALPTVLAHTPARANADDPLIAQLKAAATGFNQKWEVAKKLAVRELERGRDAVKRAPGVTEATRADRIKEWDLAKEQFERSGTFPADVEFARIELRYYLNLNKAFRPIAKLIDDAIGKGNRTNDSELVEQALKIKTRMEEQMLGAVKLQDGSRWRGTLTRKNGSTIPYLLVVREREEGGSFRGHVEDNPGVAGHWRYEVEGQISGLGYEYAMTKSLRGNLSAVRVNGVISGDRIVGEVVQIIKGKAHPAIIVLDRIK